MAVLAPMPMELKAFVAAGRLRRCRRDPLFSHAGRIGPWEVAATTIGMGPAMARAAAEAVCGNGRPSHVMVVGIAGGLDPELSVGSLLVPERVRLYPDGPEFRSHPLPGRVASGGLMTADALFDDDSQWRPVLESGYGALDMEAAGVAEVCERCHTAWSVYRGISDRPDEHLVNQAVFALSKPDGTPDLGAAARYVARDPRRIRALSHMARSSSAAARVAAAAACADLAGTSLPYSS